MTAGCGAASNSAEKRQEEAKAAASSAEAVTAASKASEESDDAASGSESSAYAANAGDSNSTAGNGNPDTTIKVWVPDNTVDFTKEKIADFQKENADAASYTFDVQAVGEGDAAKDMLTDVESGADVYSFAQDQLARLIAADAILEVAPENAEKVKEENDEGSVSAATVGDTLYAYPLTSDNGYFLYYDKDVVTDPADLDAILSDCADAGKNFYFQINEAWYQSAFFFATGCKFDYTTDAQGNFTACDMDYASDAGVVALREMARVAESPAFQNGSTAGKMVNPAAFVDGTWDTETAKQLLGDGYACAKLPSFTGSDGKTYQMSGFSGYKLMGVKPQENAGKLVVCDALAAYLSSEEVQIGRYQEFGWGPSNLEAKKDPAIQSDEALTALNEQMAVSKPQGQYPDQVWDYSKGFGDDIIQGKINSSMSDDELMAALQTYQDTCVSYAEQ